MRVEGKMIMEQKKMERVELQLHTTMSNEISLIRPKDVVMGAMRHGMKAIAVTDLNSVQNFYEIARCQKEWDNDLKVIYGAELVHNDAATTVLVKNQEGLKPLYKLISGKTITAQERQHLLFGVHDPKLMRELDMAGYEGNSEELCRLVEDYDYIELRTGDGRTHQVLNQRLYHLGKKLGKPVVAVGNCHYLSPEDKIAKDMLDEVRNHWSNQDETYLRSTEEMLEQYAYLGKEAAYEVVVINTNKLADEVAFVDPTANSSKRFLLPNAAAEVRRICEEKLQKLYGDQPQIRTRLEQELALCNAEAVSMYLLCHKIVKHIQERGGLIGERGTVGSTLIAYLLDIADTNPLSAHYRCLDCKYTENAQADSGFDLPKKVCPHCGKLMIGDGHNIPFETCLGVNGEVKLDIDLNFSNVMRLEAKRFLTEYLGEDRIARAGTIATYSERIAQAYLQVYEDMTGCKLPDSEREEIVDKIIGIKRCEGKHPGGFMLLPEGVEWEDITPLRSDEDELCSYATHMGYLAICDAIPKLDLLSATYYALLEALFQVTDTKPEDIDYQDPAVYALFRNQDTCGIPEFFSQFTKELLTMPDDLHFSDLVKISGMAHGTNAWNENGAELMKAHPFRELISVRDDVFLTLRSNGVDRETAYTAMKWTRMGRLRHDMPKNKELIEKLHQAGVPEWYLESMKKVRYLFPKSHAVHYVKLGYMTAWFKVHYPEAFYTVTLEQMHTEQYEDMSNEDLEDLLKTKTSDFNTYGEREAVHFLLEARQRGYTTGD